MHGTVWNKDWSHWHDWHNNKWLWTRGWYTIKKHHKWITESQILLSCKINMPGPRKASIDPSPIPTPTPQKETKVNYFLKKLVTHLRNKHFWSQHSLTSQNIHPHHPLPPPLKLIYFNLYKLNNVNWQFPLCSMPTRNPGSCMQNDVHQVIFCSWSQSNVVPVFQVTRYGKLKLFD